MHSGTDQVTSIAAKAALDVMNTLTRDSGVADDNGVRPNPDGSVTVTLTDEEILEADAHEADTKTHILCTPYEHCHRYRLPNGRTVLLCRPSAERAGWDEAQQWYAALMEGHLNEDDLRHAVDPFMDAGWLRAEDLPITTLEELSARLEVAIERGLPPDPWQGPSKEREAWDVAQQYYAALMEGHLNEDDLRHAVDPFMDAGWLRAEDLPITTLEELSARLEVAIERGLPPDPWRDEEESADA
jgi:hypothetical protein